MAKPKTPKPAPPAKALPKPDESLATEEVQPTALSAGEWALLEKVNTFLFHIQAYAARAKVHGYDDKEHELGKTLLETASGRNRPLSHWIAEGVCAGLPAQFTAEQMRFLQDIDGFENTWFPRIRTILQRALPDDRQELFIAAFFKDLSQQPLGPGVLDSVTTLLDRFQTLESSKEPGAKEAYELGVKRGLTKAKVAHVRGLIESAKKAIPEAGPASLSPAELAKAKKEQLDALRQLRRWFNDWATTFRDVFGTRILIRLGLAALKRSSREETEEGTEEETEEETEDSEEEEAGEEPAAAPAGGKDK